MFASLRKTLVESHVAAIAVAYLLLFAVENLFGALREPALYATTFLVTAVASLTTVHELPQIPPNLDAFTKLKFEESLIALLYAAVAFILAWLFSRWAFGLGPLRSLATYREKLKRKTTCLVG